MRDEVLTPKQFFALLNPEFARPTEPLRNFLQEKTLKNIIIIVCSDHYRARKFVTQLKKSFAINERPEEVATYFGLELNSNSVLDQLNDSLIYRSLFCSTELIIIYELESLKQAQQKKLLERISSFKIEPFLICTTSDLPGSKQCPAFINSLAKASLVVSLPNLDQQALLRWTKKDAEEAGATLGIDDNAAQALISIVGNDPTELHQELSKLALLNQESKPINKDSVEKHCHHRAESSVQELLACIARKDTVNALLLTERLIWQGSHPLQISAFLSNSLRTMLAISGSQKSLNKNKSMTQEFKSPDLSRPWVINKLQPLLQRFSFRELRLGVETLRTLDYQLKSSSIAPEMLLSLAIRRLANRTNT